MGASFLPLSVRNRLLTFSKSPAISSILSAMPVHDALFLPEITLRILAELVGYHQDLAGCARVCKAFCEPALRALWSEIPDFWPFMGLLSYEVRKEPMGDDKLWNVLGLSGDDVYVSEVCLRIALRTVILMVANLVSDLECLGSTGQHTPCRTRALPVLRQLRTQRRLSILRHAVY